MRFIHGSRAIHCHKKSATHDQNRQTPASALHMHQVRYLRKEKKGIMYNLSLKSIALTNHTLKLLNPAPSRLTPPPWHHQRHPSPCPHRLFSLPHCRHQLPFWHLVGRRLSSFPCRLLASSPARASSPHAHSSPSSSPPLHPPAVSPPLSASPSSNHQVTAYGCPGSPSG